MRQQFLDAAGRVGRQALEHVLQVDVWIEVGDRPAKSS
jgi:hypothetical protein